MTSVPDPLPALAADTVIDLERDYLLQNYSRYPLVVHKGKGCYVYDVNGARYLDFIAGIGVNALGHAHPRIVKVIREQAALLIHSSNLYYHEYQGPLAKKLAEISGLERTFFTNSGTEAIEGALKMIRSHGNHSGADKHEIISLENSFHGRTLGALSVTGQPKYRKDFEPLLPGVRFVPANDIAALEAAFSEPTAGMLLELIQGEGGIYPMSPEYARKARELADRYNALLVFDEIQCGVGRPGTYFAYQRTKPASACRTSWWRPNRWPAAFRWASSWRTKGRQRPSVPACTAPRSAAARWPAAWRSNSSTFWMGCCPTSSRWAAICI